MACGKIRRSFSLNLKHGNDIVNNGVSGEDELGLGFVRYTRGLGRKRIGISNDMDEGLPIDSSTNVPLLKRQCSERTLVVMMMMMMNDNYPEKSALESLPQDVLIRIICGVEHKDLKQLFNVSKSIREATVIAKKMHFAYSTPTKKIKTFRNSIDSEVESDDLDEIEAPNAPRQWRSHKTINKRKLADISVALFA